MKKKIITLITTLSMLCLVACSSVKNETTMVDTGYGATANTENVSVPPTAKPIEETTATPIEAPRSEVIEATAIPEPEPTEAPVVEATPEPTKAPYFEINNSDLIGVEWIESFVGIIDEAKVVVYSLETGRKEIIEKDAIVKINPEKDILAVYLPEGYKFTNRRMGIFSSEGEVYEHSEVFYFDVKTTWEKGPQMAAVYVEHNDKEIALSFVLVPEE